MSAFASAAFSTGAFSVDAFSFDSGAPTTPVAPSGPPYPPSGGIPAFAYAKGPTPEQIRRSRIAHGIIDDVARRQAEALDLDAIQRRQELEWELRLRGIEMQGRDLALLNRKREALITAEIARLLHQKMQDDDAAFLMILAASL